MPVYHLLKIRHTAVGHFDGIPVEYFPEGVILGKGSFHYFKEISSHSGFAIEGPGWVKPDDISFSISISFIVVGWFWLKFNFISIS